MLRHCLLACAIALATIPACAAGPSTASTVSLHTNIATTDLYGKTCHTLESRERGAVSTRYCRGANGYALLVHENQGRSSIDIVAPGKEACNWTFGMWWNRGCRKWDARRNGTWCAALRARCWCGST